MICPPGQRLWDRIPIQSPLFLESIGHKLIAVSSFLSEQSYLPEIF